MVMLAAVAISNSGCKKQSANTAQVAVPDAKQIQQPPLTNSISAGDAERSKPATKPLSDLFKSQILQYLRDSEQFRSASRLQKIITLYSQEIRLQPELKKLLGEHDYIDLIVKQERTRFESVTNSIPDFEKMHQSFNLLSDLWPADFAKESRTLLKNGDIGFNLALQLGRCVWDATPPNESGENGWSNFLAYAENKLVIRTNDNSIQYLAVATNVVILINVAEEAHEKGRRLLIGAIEETEKQ